MFGEKKIYIFLNIFNYKSFDTDCIPNSSIREKKMAFWKPCGFFLGLGQTWPQPKLVYGSMATIKMENYVWWGV